MNEKIQAVVGQEAAIVLNWGGVIFVQVKRVTPSGQVVVFWKSGDKEIERRFDSEGYEMNTSSSRWRRDRLRTDVATVREEEAAKARAIHAAKRIEEVRAPDVRSTYSKESMLEIISELEQKLVAARAAVEAM